MSIVRCEECEKTMDIDVEEGHTNDGIYWICDGCYEENDKEEE